ncbi:MAG: DUF167 domain-containing protein [Candidatus Micrarchaeota archaeon]|nr:DUF167 domain-containing protein [Candidatus Micrarchaeota archaeon]
MKINVRVTPNSRASILTKLDEGNYAVKVAAPATKDKANKMLIEILAEHFGIAKSKIRILQGAKGRDKLVEVMQ